MDALNVPYAPLPEVAAGEWPETIQKTNINGVLLIKRPVYPDPRGNFHESFRRSEITKVLGFFPDFCQGNESRNNVTKVLRGLHIAPWWKMVSCTAGQAFVIVVDARRKSPTFSQAFTQTLDNDNRSTILICPGCAHGYLTLADNTNYSYLASEEWSKGREVGISYADPDLKIKYPLEGPFLVSEQDSKNPTLKETFGGVNG